MEIITMACTTCPAGCALTLEVEGTTIHKVTGNTCKRGITFAEKELTTPERMLTSTVLLDINGKEILVPVKSAVPMPKHQVLDAMGIINNTIIPHGVKMGEILIPNILGCGVDIVATKTILGGN